MKKVEPARNEEKKGNLLVVEGSMAFLPWSAEIYEACRPHDQPDNRRQ